MPGLAGLGTGYIDKMVAALVEGNDSLLEKMVESKLESIGENFLTKQLSGGSAMGQRIAEAISSGGVSEFNRIGEDFIKSQIANVMPTRWYNSLRRRVHGAHGRNPAAAWARTDWASSRDDWLDNRWRHDWRSQPRDMKGRWIPGRLQYIAEQLQYRGTRTGRKKLRDAKLRKIARKKGRRAAKKIFKELKRNAR